MKKTVSVIAAVLCLGLPAAAQEGPTPRIAVVPFAALSGDVPQRAGTKAAGMLSNELKNAEGFKLVDVKRAPGSDPYEDDLEAARNQVKEAQELRSKRKFRAAEETLQKALETYRNAAPGLSDIGELQDAYVLLSAIQYNTGRDEDGAKTLDTALALAPGRELPLAKTSPLFTHVVDDARVAMQKAPKGTLLVETTPAGAAVTVDGVAMGAAPVQVSDVPPGLHVWKTQLPTGDISGGIVQVQAGKPSKVMGQATGTDPETKIIASLSSNKLDQSVVDAAKAQAKAVEADLLIFGALSRDGKNLVLDSFVIQADTGEVKRLPRSTFDAELLSAGMEFYNLVGRLAKEGLKIGTDTKVPGIVSDRLNGGGPKVAEVRYGQAPNKGDLLDPAADTKPPEQDQKRTPLKRKPLSK